MVGFEGCTRGVQGGLAAPQRLPPQAELPGPDKGDASSPSGARVIEHVVVLGVPGKAGE